MFQITRASIDALKNWFRDEMQKSDWQLIMELKKTFEIIWRIPSSKNNRDRRSRPPSDREAATEGHKKKIKTKTKEEKVFSCEKRSVFPTVVNSGSLDTFLSLSHPHTQYSNVPVLQHQRCLFYFLLLGSCCDSWMLLLGSAPFLPRLCRCGQTRWTASDTKGGTELFSLDSQRCWPESLYSWPGSAAGRPVGQLGDEWQRRF